ncbi:NAD(P)/FAD-dependent oxidoreductase [Kineobactrum salinum]|uniref:FAD-dependent oxidoreductase n=1 Tax=Kineobactrum salinum TaxID=2708301 RepID=A0A6C0TZD4_9GAMM|nr:NAD(P)/FAD-dependent oxidoreductase [Kineobactrum salinum]QIB65126.1 FAD-dependent oxidoreductase [Kineobactrum salinum]
MVYDLAVIGAGPAGLAASIEASNLGLSVVLLDEQIESGGQIYRSIASVSKRRPEDLKILGAEYRYGKKLVDAVAQSTIEYKNQSSVWNIEPNFDQEKTRIFYSSNGSAYFLDAKQAIIASGAMERPVPIHDWTLTGVMSVGAAQTILKSTGMIPSGSVVLAGSGPLLLLAAVQLHSAGTRVQAVVETTSWFNYIACLKSAPKALLAPEYLLKGLKMRRYLRQARIPVYSGARNIGATGTSEDKLERIQFTSQNVFATLDVDTLLLHDGVIPNTALTRLAGVDHKWCNLQQHWHPVVTAEGNTSIRNILVAGDSASIFGARVAEQSGRISALSAARQLGKLKDREFRKVARKLKIARWRHSMVRPMLDALFPPAISNCTDEDTIVCRCYEVTKRSITGAVQENCCTPDQIKSLLRCGMGPCQGRMCSSTVSRILADAQGRNMEEVGVYKSRPPIKPIPVSELASLERSNTGS